MTAESDPIAANVRLAVETFASLVDFEFGLDRRSVEWVEGFLERQRMRDDFDASALVGVIGSFLGQCVIAQAGGEWHRSEEDGWCVRLPNGAKAFPFAKVDKQLRNGLEDSILSFFDVAVDLVATGRLHRG